MQVTLHSLIKIYQFITKILKIIQFSSRKSEFCQGKKRDSPVGTPVDADATLTDSCADPLKVEDPGEKDSRVKKEHELQVYNFTITSGLQ